MRLLAQLHWKTRQITTNEKLKEQDDAKAQVLADASFLQNVV
jgi:hypothetical protein